MPPEPPPIEQDKAPYDYKSLCEKPKSNNEADLCQQLRMAVAAENQVGWVRKQYTATLFEIGALVFTVIFTAWAAIAASRAAIAAQTAVEVTRETSKRQLRAYVIVESCSLEEIEGGYMLGACLRNSGVTPAINARELGETYSAKYPVGGDRPHPIPGDDFGTTVGAGGTVSSDLRLFTDDNVAAMKAVQTGEIGFWIQGTAIYEDIFGETHTTKFRYVFGGRMANSGGIRLHADKDGNYAD